MKLRLWAADTFRFSVQGPEIHRFLNHASAAGVRLRRVRWQKDGCSASDRNSGVFTAESIS